MRIERLPQENQRMQGPERRAWQRIHSAEHLRAIASLMDQALAGRQAKTAHSLVLGAGYCTELPLERLARACASVTLVDVDVAHMVRARDDLPQALRAGVQVVAADITGRVSQALAAELRLQPWVDLARLAESSGRAVLDAAAGCLDRCLVPDPPRFAELAPGGYDIVISSLVLTQLFSLPLLDVVDMLGMWAPASVDLRDAYPRYHEAAARFRHRVALAHLDLVGVLLAPEGAGLLITDTRGYLMPPRSGAHAGVGNMPEVLDVLPEDVLAQPDEVSERFNVTGEIRRWRWVVSTAGADLLGREYDVAGILFKPRGGR